MQEVHLIGRQVFCLLDKQRLTGIEQAVYAILHIALRCLMLRFQPYQPSQLLYIRRIAVGHGAYLAGQFFRDMFTRHLETLADVSHPVGLTNFVKIEQIAKTVERIALVLKHLFHHVFLAAIKTIYPFKQGCFKQGC